MLCKLVSRPISFKVDQNVYLNIESRPDIKWQHEKVPQTFPDGWQCPGQPETQQTAGHHGSSLESKQRINLKSTPSSDLFSGVFFNVFLQCFMWHSFQSLNLLHNMECDLHKAWELLADFDKISFPVFLKTSRFVEIDLRYQNRKKLNKYRMKCISLVLSVVILKSMMRRRTNKHISKKSWYFLSSIKGKN